MSILIDQHTKLLIQGITGKEGTRASRESVSYGTPVLAGVTPGKGGQEVEGVPVYNTVKEALTNHPEINATFITVPGLYVEAAALEAIDAGIPLVVILAEHVPLIMCARIMAKAKEKNVRVVGPAAIGIISPGKAKVGSIGSGEMIRGFIPGPVGVISKSGGMTSEICFAFTKAGLGQSTAAGLGGEVISGSSFADMLALFAEDEETKGIAMFCEVGGSYEEEAADFIVKTKFEKPVVAIVAGRFGARLSPGTVLGHAGAIVSAGRGSYESKIAALTRAGVHIAETVEDMPPLMKKHL